MRKLLAGLLLAGILGVTAPAMADPQPEVNASGAVLMDCDTLRVLASHNAHLKLPMASTTKIMTALVAIENAELDEMVEVPQEAFGIEGSSMYLNLGERMTMEDLLYGLMLTSGNDAAVAIAHHVGGGDVNAFIEMMNNRAAEIGSLNTHFVTPNGLHDEEHFTTAYDLALITCEAMKDPVFREIVNTQYRKCTSGDVMRTLKNKNKILWQYEGGNGVKTGFTKAAGRCLVFAAERDYRQLVGVALNAPNMWGVATDLLNYGYANFTWERFVTSGEIKTVVEVENGVEKDLELVAKGDILVPIAQGEDRSCVTIRLNSPCTVKAPVTEGQTVGNIEVWCDGRIAARVPLVASKTVIKKGLLQYLWQLAKDFAA